MPSKKTTLVGNNDLDRVRKIENRVTTRIRRQAIGIVFVIFLEGEQFVVVEESTRRLVVVARSERLLAVKARHSWAQQHGPKSKIKLRVLKRILCFVRYHESKELFLERDELVLRIR